jgi:hypothetical protein
MKKKKDQVLQERHDERLSQVLAEIEGDYFLDYALFTGSMREYTVRALEQVINGEVNPSDYHRRMFMLAIYREQYTAYEDLGAFLNGFLRHHQSPDKPPLKSIFEYTSSEVRLTALFNRFEIKTGDNLCSRLQLLEWVPASWPSAFPDIDIQKVIRRMCSFFVKDCSKTQSDLGVVAFNKLKHGLMFIPSGRRFRSDWLDAPGILFQSRRDQPRWVEDPVTVYQIPLGADEVEGRLQAIHFVETGLRLLSSLYVITRHADALHRRSLSDIEVLQHPYMADVMDIVRQSSAQPWNP